MAQTYEMRLLCDFNQFGLEDSEADPMIAALPSFWDERAQRDGFATARNAVGIGTARSGFTAVTLSVREGAPADEVETWDHVVDGAIEATSGLLRVRGCTEMPEDAESFEVAPGTYCLRAFYGNMDVGDASAEEGDDHYKIVLWPGEWRGPQVVKRYNG